MFSDLRDRIKLRKIKRSHAQLVKAQDEAMKTFKAQAPSQLEVERKTHGHQFEWEETADEIAQIETKFLLRKAYKRHIIIPPRVEGEL